MEGERDRRRGEVDAQVSSLADAQLLELQNWVNETYHKKYVYEGVAVGAIILQLFPSGASMACRGDRVDCVEVE